MTAESRLNILLTHQQPTAGRRGTSPATADVNPWYHVISCLLAPLGVRTFEATTGAQAMDLIEQNPIHLAVVDTRLHGTDPLGVLRLIQRLQQRSCEADYAAPAKLPAAGRGHRIRVRVEGPQGEVEQRIEVRFGSPAPAARPQVVPPTVILVTPGRNDQLLAEAMKFNAFSVMQEPIDLNLMLDVMARAMRRFHQNLWPQ